MGVAPPCHQRLSYSYDYGYMLLLQAMKSHNSLESLVTYLYTNILSFLFFSSLYSRVGAEGRDAVIDVLIKVIPKNKLAVELFVKIGGTAILHIKNNFKID